MVFKVQTGPTRHGKERTVAPLVVARKCWLGGTKIDEDYGRDFEIEVFRDYEKIGTPEGSHWQNGSIREHQILVGSSLEPITPILVIVLLVNAFNTDSIAFNDFPDFGIEP